MSGDIFSKPEGGGPMANPEHLELLKQGVDAWNRWREEQPDIRPDLRGAYFPRRGFRRLNLINVNLSKAILVEAKFTRADFEGANLNEADLHIADLRWADLHGADLRMSNLQHADFSWADLREADLSGALLAGATLRESKLSGVDLSRCSIGWSTFMNVNLSCAKGIESLKHRGPSSIGINTIYRSKGKIPESFLRGCGVPDSFIEYMPSLVENAIQYYSCFISYSNKDKSLAERLHADLQSKGLRVWFAPEDLKIGDRFRQSIDVAVHTYDKLMVLLSKNSIESTWVEKEVETAFEEERKRGKTMLFPIRLDNAVMETDQAWAADIRRTRHIGDFRKWKDHDSYQKAFDGLLRDLKAEEEPAGTEDE
jgi:hypothetical protein